jgi:hypothetical protein
LAARANALEDFAVEWHLPAPPDEAAGAVEPGPHGPAGVRDEALYRFAME